MSAKQRHKQRVIQRLKEKHETLSTMEENLHTVVRDHVLKAQNRCLEVLNLADTNQFLQQYSKVEQLLDAAFNLVELLTSSAEDMIENADNDTPDEDDLSMDKTLLSSTPIPSKEKLEKNRNDPEISPETEAISHGSSCEKHRTSETACQTLPDEDSKRTGTKMKKSPKKKIGKLNSKSFKDSQTDKNHSTKDTTIKPEKNNKDVTNIEKDMGKYSECEFIPRKQIKSIRNEQSEVSSEPTMTSSEQSIPEHELTEVWTTESCETSSSSDLKSFLKDRLLNLKKQVEGRASKQTESHLNEKSNLDTKETSVAKLNEAVEQVADKSEHSVHEEDKTRAKLEETKDTTSADVLVPGNLLLGKITPVIVSEVVSPWCFFLQQNGPHLNQLMEKICTYMSLGGLKKLPLLDPEVGTFCLARYSVDSAFYRAYVVQVHKAIRKLDTEVDVLYVDYGNRERLNVTHLRTLPEKFKSLPTQAICCALAEVMPCNKYCAWAEDDIHLFRQYVTGQQLGCTPPTCRSSGEPLPLLVELIVNLPVPALPQGGIYLGQFSIAKLMIGANKARHVDVAEQLGLLAKSREGAEEAAILSHNMTAPSRLAVTEISESPCKPLNKEEPTKQNETLDNNDDHDKKQKNKEESNLNRETEVSSADITSSEDTSKQTRSDIISPRSENSDTESQNDERHKGSGKKIEKSVIPGNRGQLDKIKEEVTEVDSCDTASTGTSLATDIDFPPDKGVHLSDLHFDLDNLYFNPQGQEVMLAHVKSPDEFYVHIISQQSGETLDRLMKNLNSLFETANRRKLTKLSKTFEAEEKKLCCAQFLQDNNFYRGIILCTTPEKEIMKGRVLVHYIDFGDEEWLPKRRIFPLPLQFCNVPRLALKCSLSYIKPVGGEEDKSAHWSKKSTEKFIDIAGLEKTLHMHVLHGSLEEFKKSNPCDDSPVLGILLVDNTGTEEVCVNMALIRDGVAELDTSEAKIENCNTQERSPDIKLDKWNPMEEDFFSKRNSINIDIDDAGVATTGYKAKDEESICKYFSSGRDCWKGDRCPYRHVRVESGMTYDKEPVYAISDNQRDILPQKGSWVAMEIATILSPSHFYVILPLGNKSLDATSSEPEKSDHDPFGVSGNEETLDDLLDALNTEYSKRPAHDGSPFLRAIGENVVAKFSLDQSWYRARIIEVTDQKVKVFFVDFGNTEWLAVEEIADIKPEFLHLPFQAIECFMNIEPKGEEKWTKDSRIEFRDLVNGKTLVGHIKSKSWNGCLWVELYDTSREEDVNVGEELVQRGHALKGESHDSQTDISSSISLPSDEIFLVPG